MSLGRKIADKIYTVGVIDWNRRLFDELVQIPDGTTYNSYFVDGSEKKALIDSVDPTKTEQLLKNLESLAITRIDYIIANHAEQDHSGAIPILLTKFPEAIIMTNAKCKELLKEFLLIPEEKFRLITDGEKVSLGDKTLVFQMTPWVHWPDTQCVYVPEEKLLFSCDFFGSHMATSDLFCIDETISIPAAKHYYAEIMMPFRKIIRTNIEKIKLLDIKLIAPSHGPLHNEPKKMIDIYSEWCSDKVKNLVLIPYVSMHESTKVMAEYLTNSLIDLGVEVQLFDLTKTDTGKIATALVDAGTVLIGSPTVLGGAHPMAAYAAFLTNALRPKIKLAGIFGSYGWGGRMVEQLKGMLPNISAEILEPVVIKGYPKENDFVALKNLAIQISEKHKAF
jgi:flavorubredoxin